MAPGPHAADLNPRRFGCVIRTEVELTLPAAQTDLCTPRGATTAGMTGVFKYLFLVESFFYSYFFRGFFQSKNKPN